MDRKSIIQEYYILAVNDKGYMPPMRKDECDSGMVAAGVMDLLLKEVIIIEKNKITVNKNLPGELGYLMSLYTYLNEKPRTIEKLMSDYVASTGSRIKELTRDLGESLLTDQSVTKGEGGLFGNKTLYIPDGNYKNELISCFKSAVLNGEELTSHDVALVCILKETKNLHQYFSGYESDGLKARLRELKKNPQNKQLAEMVNYVSDMTTIMMAWMASL